MCITKCLRRLIKNNETSDESTELQDNCFKFFSQLRDLVNEELEKQDPSREVLDKKIRTLISDHRNLVSRSCLMLGEWHRSLIWRKSKGKLVRLRSVKRYFNALSVCFQAIAYDHDLMACDEEDVTEFYRRVMEIRQLVRPATAIETLKDQLVRLGDGEDANKTDLGDEKSVAAYYRTQSLALQLLKDFHRLVSREFGVEDPDWSEISVVDELLSISPSILTEAEYVCALQMLAPSPDTATREQLARTFILLVGYRFGLRGAEITGLLRSDWVDDQPDSIVVLVRGNKFRRLKTTAGQRQVPLLFLLSEHEKKIIAHWLDSWRGITTLNGDGALFAELQKPEKLMNDKLLRWEVSEVMKQVSKNPSVSLHHTRHAFANNAALLLIDNTDGIWPHVMLPEQTTRERKNHVRRLLLSTDQVTRRTLWAIARLLGHAHPNTSARSYIHLVPDLTARYVNLHDAPSGVDLSESAGVITYLDQLEVDESYLEISTTPPVITPARPMTADQAIRFIHLLQRGTPRERARGIIGISAQEADRINRALVQTDRILERRQHVNPSLGGGYILTSHIPESRWRILTSRAFDVNWPTEISTPGLRVDQISEVIGSTRQILLWKKDHFSFFNEVVTAWNLSKASFSFICSPRSKSELLITASTSKLSQDFQEKLELELSAGKSSKQIDQVETGYPAMLVRHRCAVLANTEA
ncbi:MAG: hypothetical protein ACREBU_11410, partial [Nitrososphaera sp.]